MRWLSDWEVRSIEGRVGRAESWAVVREKVCWRLWRMVVESGLRLEVMLAVRGGSA